MAKYKNPVYKRGISWTSPEYYTTDAKPTKHAGCLIYHRIKSCSPGGDCFDIVKDGVCISQYAGLNSAKKRAEEYSKTGTIAGIADLPR